MLSLHMTNSLRSVHGAIGDYDPELSMHLLPQLSYEGLPVVRARVGGYAEPPDPAPDEGGRCGLMQLYTKLFFTLPASPRLGLEVIMAALRVFSKDLLRFSLKAPWSLMPGEKGEVGTQASALSRVFTLTSL